MRVVRLYLPGVLITSLWQHAQREMPHECVGALGGLWTRGEQAGALARAAYPLPNIATRPEQEYLADPGALLRALRAMTAENLTLVGLYHSHPRGPARPSLTDEQRAAYPVPYVIADLSSKTLRAYLLPTGEEVELVGADSCSE
ncbi:M67 family metallopeptidase [Deinococcus sp.]|uniref:M67 family metallopeptidase n=1 Tax=Deinococcus sp. TaxID=47478 RepID=UPI0025C10F17|nr:M67 family metallopeptidase [Deinococcus sp.]